MSAAHRELLLLRHGKSAWDTAARSDFDRPLAARGQRDCPRIADWLAGEGLLPDRILSSPAHRAVETARIVAQRLGFDVAEIETDEQLYGADLTALLAALAALPSTTRRVLLVAHNPGLDALVAHLAGRCPKLAANGKLMTTAAVACFAMPESWEHLHAGAGDLTRLMRPKDL